MLAAGSRQPEELFISFVSSCENSDKRVSLSSDPKPCVVDFSDMRDASLK